MQEVATTAYFGKAVTTVCKLFILFVFGCDGKIFLLQFTIFSKDYHPSLLLRRKARSAPLGCNGMQLYRCNVHILVKILGQTLSP
jgi:hypothetical protein